MILTTFGCGVMCLLLALLPAAAEAAGADAARIDALLAEGDRLASISVHRADLALAAFREAWRLSERAGDAARSARSAISLGTALFGVDRMADAEAALTAGLRAAEKAGDTAIQANALRQLGIIYITEARYDTASDVLDRGLTLARANRDADLVARILSNLSASAIFRGRNAEALARGQEAVAEVDRALARGAVVSPAILFAAPFNYAKALAGAGDYLTAAPWFERAYAAAERSHNLGAQHHVLYDSAEWYRAQGDLDRAARYYQRSLEQSRQILDSREGEAKSWCGLGAVAERQRAFARAVEMYGRCAAIFESRRYGAQLPAAVVSLSRAQAMNGQPLEGRASIDRARALAHAAGQAGDLVDAHLERGRQSLAAGKLEDAAADYRAAEELALARSLLPLEPAALVGLASVARAQDDLAGAVRWLRASVAAVERIRGRIVSIDQRAAFAEAAHTTFSLLVAILAEQHRRDPRAGHDREAFDAVEQERTRNVAAALSEGAPREAEGAGREERALDQRLAETQTELASGEAIAARRAVLVATLDDLERQLDAAKAKGPGAAIAEERSLDALQRVLHEDEGFVEYVLAEGAAFAFFVRREDFALVPLTLPAGFSERIHVFGRLLASPDGRDAEATGRVLSDALLRAVLASAGSRIRTLIIAVAGDAATLPFAALPDPGRRDAVVPLMERFDVAYVPSLAALHLLRTKPRTAATRDLIAVADPPQAEGVAGPEGTGMPARLRARGSLPYSREEVTHVARMSRRAPEVLIGAAASETRFKSAPIDQFRVLHFAAHTVLDAQVPARSAIALATPDPGVEDGLLQGREVYGMRLAADLVVLSACRSAGGRGSSAEGLHSLARAFLYAGAQSILGTSWDVDDRPAAALVKRVYDRVAQGDTIGAALAAAQRAAGGSSPYARSADWAAFAVVGDPAARPDLQRPGVFVRSPVAAWSAAMAGVLALVLLAAVTLRARFGPA